MPFLAQIDVAGMWICFFVGIGILCALFALALLGIVWLITSRRSSKPTGPKDSSSVASCPVCGSSVSPHVIRCPHCGASLKGDDDGGE